MITRPGRRGPACFSRSAWRGVLAGDRAPRSRSCLSHPCIAAGQCVYCSLSSSTAAPVQTHRTRKGADHEDRAGITPPGNPLGIHHCGVHHEQRALPYREHGPGTSARRALAAPEARSLRDHSRGSRAGLFSGEPGVCRQAPPVHRQSHRSPDLHRHRNGDGGGGVLCDREPPCVHPVRRGHRPAAGTAHPVNRQGRGRHPGGREHRPGQHHRRDVLDLRGRRRAEIRPPRGIPERRKPHLHHARGDLSRAAPRHRQCAGPVLSCDPSFHGVPAASIFRMAPRQGTPVFRRGGPGFACDPAPGAVRPFSRCPRVHEVERGPAARAGGGDAEHSLRAGGEGLGAPQRHQGEVHRR